MLMLFTYFRVPSTSGTAVMRVQCDQEASEYTALTAVGIQLRGVSVWNSLESVCVEVLHLTIRVGLLKSNLFFFKLSSLKEMLS